MTVLSPPLEANLLLLADQLVRLFAVLSAGLLNSALDFEEAGGDP